jgi:SDR family mycofactocin-dependent oxidoreductase
MARFDGQVVLITGGARGQGRAHALAFAREGAHISLCDLCAPLVTIPYPLATTDDLAETAAQVEALGRRALALRADVRRRADMERVRDATLAAFGRIDILVANAGAYSFGPSWELSEEQWDETVDTCLKGAWLACRAVIPPLIARRQGKIICIASTAAQKGLANLAHYTAAKHGVLGLVRALAIELAPYNINVNAVLPTGIDTAMCNNQAIYDLFHGSPGGTREEMIGLLNQMNLFADRDLLPPEAVSAAVLWLASEEARHITGHALPVDAGFLTR